jgi:hypothetical protein
VPKPRTVRAAVSRLLIALDRMLAAAREVDEARRDLDRVCTIELHVTYDDDGDDDGPPQD